MRCGFAIVTLTGCRARVALDRNAAQQRQAPGQGRHSVIACARRPQHLLLHAGFFTCGFPSPFLVTHLPGEVNRRGLPPSVASWSFAIPAPPTSSAVCSPVGRHALSQVRVVLDVRLARCDDRVYLMAPRTDFTFLLPSPSAWLHLVSPLCRRPPPSSARCRRRAHLGTLFGLTAALAPDRRLPRRLAGPGDHALRRLFVDVVRRHGARRLFAALVNLPIREARVIRTQHA